VIAFAAVSRHKNYQRRRAGRTESHNNWGLQTAIDMPAGGSPCSAWGPLLIDREGRGYDAWAAASGRTKRELITQKEIGRFILLDSARFLHP
jgi:hypothetical protein